MSTCMTCGEFPAAGGDVCRCASCGRLVDVGEGNQQPSGLRGDPAVPGTVTVPTRDPVSASFSSLSGAARALVEQWREYARSCRQNQKRYEICADELDTLLSALLAQAGAPQENAAKELALLREAAQDASLSDGAVRAIVLGTQPPTADDVEWARQSLQKIGEAGAPQEEKDEKNLDTRVGERTASPLPVTTAGTVLPTPAVRSEELLRKTLSMLCNYIWTKQLRPGEHMWSIPVDKERDFDCILSDAIAELVEQRKSLEMLHGAKFSDRVYAALKSRAETAEAALARLAPYVQHKPECHINAGLPAEWSSDPRDRIWKNDVDCTCGLRPLPGAPEQKNDEKA